MSTHISLMVLTWKEAVFVALFDDADSDAGGDDEDEDGVADDDDEFGFDAGDVDVDGVDGSPWIYSLLLHALALHIV